MESFKLTTLFVLLLLSISIVTSCGEEDIPGCTDPNSDNFTALATVDDGSCVISGCTDPAAENFNAAANRADDGTCVFARDKFIGTFLGSINCLLVDQFNSESTTVLLEPNPDDITKISITIETDNFTIPIDATVDGDRLLLIADDFPFDVTILGVQTSVLIDLDGEATINESQDVISGGFTASILNPLTGAEILADSCTLMATRS